jgi:two-component system, LytTR family, response regulator
MTTTTPLKAIIIEDDPKDSTRLKNQLARQPIANKVLAVCTNVKDAFDCITMLKPDLLFLDIELDYRENGFDLLKLFPSPDFSIIFTTGYLTQNNFINAIRVCAFDFLSKPVSAKELGDALRRYNRAEGLMQTKMLKKNIESVGMKLCAIMISSNKAKIPVETENIIFINSSGPYTLIVLSKPVDGKQEFFTSVAIKDRESELADSDIVRCHREWMINLKYIVRFSNVLTGGAIITLRNGKKVPVSKRRKKEVNARWLAFSRSH